MESIEFVFFDLDRTLWDFESNSRATLEELFDEFSLADKLGVGADEFITEYKRINEIFWADYRNGIIDKAKLRHARFQTALQYFNYSNDELAAEIGEQYISRSPRKTNLVDGTIELLEYLKPKYRLNIITNGFEEVQHIKMDSSGLSPYFENVITSEAAGAKKPDPIVFQHAQKLAGSNLDNSIMIGDHFEADVEGALKFGWKSVYFDCNTERIENDGSFIEIKHLSELMEIL